MKIFTKAKTRLLHLILVFAVSVSASGCAGVSMPSFSGNMDSSENGIDVSEQELEIPGLSLERVIRPKYANGFLIACYEGKTRIAVFGAQERFFRAFEEGGIEKYPEGDCVALRGKMRAYMGCSGSYGLAAAAGAGKILRFSSLTEDGWHRDDAKAAMESGKMRFAGKYSQPDYEMLLDSGCNLAIESTMIYHSPEVKEKLEGLGIPVFVDKSSYEAHPLGKLEWVLVYGALFGDLEQAEAFFADQEAQLLALPGEDSGKSAAYFFINAQGAAVVRRSSDYIVQLLGMAGARYAFPELEPGPGSRSGSVSLSLEEFCQGAREADFLIYNGTIAGELSSLEELIDKNPVFADFSAVKSGNVYATGRDFYQSPEKMAAFASDVRKMLSGDGSQGMEFLRKVG